MPDLIDDPELGQLVWDADMRWWASEIDFAPGHSIEVLVEFDPQCDNLEGVLARARAQLSLVRQRKEEYRVWSAKQLVDRRWNKQEPMNIADIASLLKIASLACAPDGTTHIYWDDNGVLSHGRGVCTLLNAEGECAEVRMQ
jgi:hypothetical protein